MKYLHTCCGGLINTKTRTCTRCHHHWNWFTWWFNPTGIRPIPERQDRPKGITYRKGSPEGKPVRVQYAHWGNKIPGVGTVASRLPNWPRWARILVTVALAGTVGFLLWWLIW